jgi:hypothetical protein
MHSPPDNASGPNLDGAPRDLAHVHHLHAMPCGNGVNKKRLCARIIDSLTATFPKANVSWQTWSLVGGIVTAEGHT